MARRCPTHGVIWRHSVEHCPHCGSETSALLAFPRKMRWILVVCSVICVVGFGIALIAYFSIQHERRLENEQKARQDARRVIVETLPDDWRAVYYALSRMSSGRKMTETLKRYCDQSDLGPLTPEQALLFMSLFDRHWERDKKAAFEIVGKYANKSDKAREVDNHGPTTIRP